MNDSTSWKILAGSFLLYRAHALYSTVSWESALQSGAYKFVRQRLDGLVQWVAANDSTIEKIIGNNNQIAAYLSSPAYRPLLLDGTRGPVVSKSPQPHKTIDLDSDEDPRILQPYKLAGLSLKNRIIRAAAYDGAKVEDIVATHEGVAKGGVGMTVVAYCCVSRDGRSFDDQVDMTNKPRAFATLKPVVEACHKYGTAICAQLTHGGGFSESALHNGPNIAPSAIFNAGSLSIPRACEKQDIVRLINDFAEAARFAVNEIGFDAVEVHCGHGYLLSQWMSPLLNARTDEYGGSVENRIRLPVEICRAIRAALGKNVPILVKMNCQDGVQGGLELPEALIMAELLAKECDMLVITSGLVTHSPFYLLRGTTPLEKLVLALHGIKRHAAFLFGPFAIATVPYDDCFHRDASREILKRVGDKTQVCLLGGVSSLTEMEGAIEEGFAAVQMARPLIREPDFVLRIRRELREAKAAHRDTATVSQRGEDEVATGDEFEVETKCIRCNQCVIVSIDPHAQFGCPFRRMEEAAAARAAVGGNAENRSLSISPTMARSIVRDIEDIHGPKL